MESITANEFDSWECLCGNEPSSDGFYPCDEQGNEVEPTPAWNGLLYVCVRCGRIIDQDSLQVVGNHSEPASGENEAKQRGPVILPVFRGYTVDERLREFRKVDHGTINQSPSIGFVAFDSPKGRRLLKAWLSRSRR